MLRHGQQHDATRLECLVDLRQHRFVFVDMFDDIERAQCIEMALERDVARIYLDELRMRQAARRMLQSGAEYLRHQFCGGEVDGDIGESEAGAAAYFHERSERRRVVAEEHADIYRAQERSSLTESP